MQHVTIVLAAGLLALAGCGANPPLPPAPPPCGATGYAPLVGKSLAAITLPSDLDARIIQPGYAMTTDYRASRLNIETDVNGTIIRVYCG